MLRSPKTIAITVSTVIVLIATFVIISFYGNNQPGILDESVNESTIYIEATRQAILFPGECLQVHWEINGVNAVYILKRNQQNGTTGADSATFCIWQENPHFRVDFPDGSSEIFTLEIQHLYSSPFIVLSLIIMIVATCVIAYFTIGVPGILVIITIVGFTPFFSINANTELDFYSHLYWIQNAIDSGNYQNLPVHFIFHYAIILLKNIFPSMSLMTAAFWVVILAQIGTVTGFYALFRTLDPRSKDDRRLQLIYGVIAFALMWTGPISYFISGTGMPRTVALLYANTYHSPTTIVIRPFAIWLFVSLVNIPSEWSKRFIAYLFASILFLILGSFSKPSYSLVIVPAYLCLIGLQFLRDRKINKHALLLSAIMIIMIGMILSWQFGIAFNPESNNELVADNSQILVKWFGLYDAWGLSYQTVILSWLTSLVFPIAVYSLYIKKTWKDDMLNLAWIALLGALAMALLFIEIPRTTHGNFAWGGQITTLILFGASASFLIRQYKDQLDWRFYLCIFLFSVHVLHFSYVLLNFYQ